MLHFFYDVFSAVSEYNSRVAVVVAANCGRLFVCHATFLLSSRRFRPLIATFDSTDWILSCPLKNLITLFLVLY